MSRLEEIAEEIRQNHSEKALTVRELLRYFGQERRGKLVAAEIRSSLQREKLETSPDFEVVHIDTSIVLRERAAHSTKGSKDAPLVSVSNSPSDSEVVLTIGQLEEANRPPLRVTRQDRVNRAITLMMQNGTAHLAVMRGERQVDGILSWQTLGKARASPKPTDTVEHYMSQVRIVEVDTPLFEAVRDIIESEAVLVRAKDRTICGMVTGKDIAKQFVTLSEPFLFLEQIENHLRAILEKVKMSSDEVRALVNPADGARQAKVKSVHELSFGETSRAFSKQGIWSKLHFELDCGEFCRRLEEVRSIRNKVMHFHPDGISEGDRAILRKTREMLQEL
jgi:CBS domain-containing protein